MQAQKNAFLRRYNDMKSESANWTAVWKELSRFVAPTRGFFDGDKPNDGRKIDHRALIDSDPLLAVEILSAGMVSGLTSPSRTWFELQLRGGGTGPDQSQSAKAWLYEVRRRMESVFARANVYNALHSFYQEIAVFGTAAFLLEEDPDTTVSCRTFTAGEYMLGCDEKGRVNAFGREFWMTPAQMAEKFGLENLPLSLRRAAQENRAGWFKVLHVIAPNAKPDEKSMGPNGMAWTSVYMTPSGETLRKSGYHEFPVIAARWEVRSSCDVYGRGPGWKALGDVKMLQKMQKTKLVALDKSANPPMQVSANVQGEVNLLPGGLTRYSGTTDAAVKPVYQVAVDLTALEAGMERVRQTIRGQFFADVFLMLSSAEYGKMTATEVAERHQEKMLVLGPVLERLKNELLDPLIERTFAVMYRRGELPPPPPQIQGRELSVHYTSIIAAAQRASGLGALQQGLTFAAQVAQAKPEVLDGLDFDRMLKEGFDMLGVPPVVQVGEKELARKRQERAQAAAQAQAAQEAQALVQGAQTLSKTPLGAGSALDAVLGGAHEK